MTAFVRLCSHARLRVCCLPCLPAPAWCARYRSLTSFLIVLRGPYRTSIASMIFIVCLCIATGEQMCGQVRFACLHGSARERERLQGIPSIPENRKTVVDLSKASCEFPRAASVLRCHPFVDVSRLSDILPSFMCSQCLWRRQLEQSERMSPDPRHLLGVPMTI